MPDNVMDGFLAFEDRRSETVRFQGLELLVLEMTAAKRIEYECLGAAAKAAGGTFDHVSHMVAFSVVDPATKDPRYTVEQLSQKSPRTLLKLFEAAMRVNSLGSDAVEQAKGE